MQEEQLEQEARDMYMALPHILVPWEQLTRAARRQWLEKAKEQRKRRSDLQAIAGISGASPKQIQEACNHLITDDVVLAAGYVLAAQAAVNVIGVGGKDRELWNRQQAQRYAERMRVAFEQCRTEERDRL